MTKDPFGQIEAALTSALEGQGNRVASMLEARVKKNIAAGVRTGPKYSTRKNKFSIKRGRGDYLMPPRWYPGGYAQFRAAVASDGYRSVPNFNRTGFLLSKLKARSRQSKKRGEIRAYLTFETESRPYKSGERRLKNSEIAEILARRAGATRLSSAQSPFSPSRLDTLDIFRQATRAAVAEANRARRQK